MKTLKTFFCMLVLGLVFPLIASAQATQKSIPLQADKDNVQNRSSLLKVPVFVSMSDASLYSDFVMAIGEVGIVVTDQSEKTIIQKSIFIMGEQKDTISLTDLPKGTYKVSYFIGDCCFYGTFEIE